jgi:CheY-like chemotaxis protein
MAYKLLLADDSVTIQRVIELTFSGENVDVVAVGDGEQAIARIPAERPDIILADIGMPKRSGYDVAAFVKNDPDLRHIPVLLLAGAFEPVDEAKAEQTHCDGVLVKPFEPQHVIARVRELLEGGKGTPTQVAAAHVPRAVERLTRDSAPGRGDRRETPAAAATLTARPGSGAPGADSGRDTSLDDYFDRLDAAFAEVGTGPPAPIIDLPDPDLGVPTLDEVLSRPLVLPPPIEPPETSATLAPAPAATTRTDRATDNRNVIADVFTMLLAAERGEGSVSVRVPGASQEPVVTDALVDEVTRRVLARLAPAAAREVVVEVVSEIAERLVREEIARIRGTS